MSLNRAHYDKSNDKKGTNDNNQYYNSNYHNQITPSKVNN
jgi:hypothetical protein